MIDNPEKLQRIVEETGAYPTQVNNLTAVASVSLFMKYAKAWGEVADGIWEKNSAKKTETDK